MGTSDAQRLIALSLGKIAASRQQRGGINLHKNLLVASVLHKARTTYMMDNFQVLLANKKAQAEKEAAEKRISEPDTPKSENTNNESVSMEESVQRGVADSPKVNNTEAQSGEHVDRQLNKSGMAVDKENVAPVNENKKEHGIKRESSEEIKTAKKRARETKDLSPIVTGKVPLSQHNGSSDYVNQLPACRCAGGKRRRSFVGNECVTLPKKPRMDGEDSDSDFYSDSESESENESSRGYDERMQVDSPQVTSLVDVFSSGFNGLCKGKDISSDSDSISSTGHVNVYVSSDRSLSSQQYVLTDLSCSTQVKDNVTFTPVIALAV